MKAYLTTAFTLVAAITFAGCNSGVESRTTAKATQDDSNTEQATSGGLELAQPSSDDLGGADGSYQYHLKVEKLGPCEDSEASTQKLCTVSVLYDQTMPLRAGKVQRMKAEPGDYNVLIEILNKSGAVIYAGQSKVNVDENGQGKASVELLPLKANESAPTSANDGGLVISSHVAGRPIPLDACRVILSHKVQALTEAKEPMSCSIQIKDQKVQGASAGSRREAYQALFAKLCEEKTVVNLADLRSVSCVKAVTNP